MHRVVPTTAAAALLLGANAVAQEPRADAPSITQRSIAPTLTLRETRFRFIDTDGDRFISRGEVADDASILRSQFPSLDVNGDGKLSRQEYVLSHRTPIE